MVKLNNLNIPKKVAFLGDYVPRQCGIATFTYDLRSAIAAQYPDLVYVVLGATHPNIVRDQGESYRMKLERMAHDLGIKKNVVFYNRFVEPEELNHLLRMTDSAGMFQHARYALPSFEDGYCTDDNARAFLLTILLEEIGHDMREIRHSANHYAAFINYAFDSDRKRFRNFMGFDRQWLEEVGSDDSQGRALWALGAEATLAFLLSLVEMHMVENSLKSFSQVTQPGCDDLKITSEA